MPFVVTSENGSKHCGTQYAMRIDGDVYWTNSKAKATPFEEAEADAIAEEINRYASTPADVVGAAAV